MAIARTSLIALATLFGLWSVPSTAALQVYAAGDIAECAAGRAARGAAATARLIPDGASVLVLGDTAYPLADAATLRSCYGPTWGRFLSTTYAVPGNHDYVGGSPRAFLDYFGRRNRGRTWFRAALGDWWVIGLDSQLGGLALERQLAWLERELAAIEGDGRCIVALWHHALFSTGLHAGDGQAMKPAWRDLDRAGVDVVLSGHEHFYESFEPRDADGHERGTGIREFVVGTGGAQLLDLSLSSSHRAFARVHGVLALELEASRYRWAFRTVDGGSRDHGEAACRRTAQAVNRTTAASRATRALMLAASTAAGASTTNAPPATGAITPR